MVRRPDMGSVQYVVIQSGPTVGIGRSSVCVCGAATEVAGCKSKAVSNETSVPQPV